MKRKLIFISLVIVLCASIIFVGCQAPAAKPTPSTGPIKIGHLRPLTGHMAIAGQFMVKGVELALDEIGNEVAGRKIEVIVEDSAAQPEMAIDKARKLVEQDKVALIIGPTVGGAQMAVSSYMNKVGVPCIHTNPSPLGVIAEKHQWTIQAAGAEPLLPSTMARYAYEELGFRKVDIISADWVPGHGFLDTGFMRVFQRFGGEVVQAQYPPVACADFASYITAFKDADAVVAWFDGTDSIKFLTQYYEFGMWDRMPLIAAFHGSFFAPFILMNLPPEVSKAMIGAVTPTPYTALLKTDVNQRFVAAFMAKFPDDPPPDDTVSGPYMGYQIVFEALKATGGDTTPEKLREAILNTQVDSPEGPVRFDKPKMSAIKTSYIVEITPAGPAFDFVPVHTYTDVPCTGF